MKLKINLALVAIGFCTGFYIGLSIISVVMQNDIVTLEERVTVLEESRVVAEAILSDFRQCENFPPVRKVPSTLSYSSGKWYFENILVAEVSEESDGFFICQPTAVMSEIMKGYS